MKTITFFNNKGGVGKTTLVYHLAYMLAEQGYKVLAADLDPQSNLTAMFLEDKLEDLWMNNDTDRTILSAVKPLMKGLGDIKPLITEKINHNLSLIIGDLGLSSFEDKLSDAWIKSSDGDEAAFRTVSSFYRIIQDAAKQQQSDVVLMDVGPNLGAINRAALIATDFVVMPVAPDLFSVKGLMNLGPTLMDWRTKWKARLEKNPEPTLPLPAGDMKPMGYVVLQHNVRSSRPGLDRPVKAYLKWAKRLPKVYRKFVLDEATSTEGVAVENDPYQLGFLKHYQSLMPMAMEVRKPIFRLKPADGAIGAHAQAVKDCYRDFKELAEKIAEVAEVTKSGTSPLGVPKQTTLFES